MASHNQRHTRTYSRNTNSCVEKTEDGEGKRDSTEYNSETNQRQLRRREDDYYCEKDLYVQIRIASMLLLGCYYYEDIDSNESKKLLKGSPTGTFLVRDSSDQNYLYTLSVKTNRGPTSIRIVYEHDADEKAKPHMPTFSCLMELIDYYVRLSRGKKSELCRFLERSGRKDLPVILKTPRLHSVPSLKHLCRLTINGCLPIQDFTQVKVHVQSFASGLSLPKALQSYIKEYPYAS
ncbi:hypothetical protein CHS0354_035128 [Potamilus streckersoni]|uniref:Suppressor of cytokine signaling 2 n=1 Tax=Potamilus streckersoni TaxID=2493646 RepID=A0AAE0TCV3_9BIVA|nr:hypothetical protein CHS0354_035128 [Potamilus streckersoni]